MPDLSPAVLQCEAHCPVNECDALLTGTVLLIPAAEQPDPDAVQLELDGSRFTAAVRAHIAEAHR